MGKGEILKLHMLSKTSVDEVFMHHFEKMSSAYGGFAPQTPTGELLLDLLGDFRHSDPLIAHPSYKSTLTLNYIIFWCNQSPGNNVERPGTEI